jgi:hypothetical protein
LTPEQLIWAGRKDDLFYGLVEAIAKGPEARLPHPYYFKDKNGKNRHHIRVKWWNGDAKSWRQIAMSVPDVNQLPDDPLPDNVFATIYPAGDKPVFFGHYWMSGEPELQSANALCLDYSAGTDGPLVTYSYVAGSRALILEHALLHWGIN